MKHEFIDKFNEPLSHLSGNPIMIVRPRWKQSVATLCCVLRLLRDWNCNERLPSKSTDIYTVWCENWMEFTIRYPAKRNCNGINLGLPWKTARNRTGIIFSSYSILSMYSYPLRTSLLYPVEQTKVINTSLYQYTTGYHNNNNRCRTTIIREGEAGFASAIKCVGACVVALPSGNDIYIIGGVARAGQATIFTSL